MKEFNRRTLMAAGTTLAAGGMFGSVSTAADDQEEESEDEEPEGQDVEFEYVYELEDNAEGDDEDVEERIELSSGELYRDGDYCTVEFEAENLTDDEDLNIYFEAHVDGNSTYESPRSLQPGESISMSLELIDGCLDDPDQGQIRAWAPYVGDPHAAPEDEPEEEPEDEPEEEEPDEEPDDDPDREEGEEPEDEDPEEEAEEEPIEDPSLELSVSASDSVTHGETACFDVTVWNHGDDVAEVTITLEVGDVTDSSTVEIAGGDCYASFHTVAGTDLDPGDTEWTVTADGETESGVLTVTDE